MTSGEEERKPTTEDFPPGRKDGLSLFGDDLKKGIWPRSLSFWMVAVYVALFIIRPWEQMFPWLGSIYFEKIYAILMIAVVLLSGGKQVKYNLQTVSVIFFFFGIALSAFFSLNTSLAWDPLYVYLTLVIFYFVLYISIKTPYELVFMVLCYIVTMAIYLAKSQWEFFVHGQHRYDMGVIRLIGIEETFGGPNSLAMSIVVSLPMFFFLWSIRKELSNGWPKFWKKWFPRFLILYFLLAVSSIILTNSRSGMLSFVFFVILVTFRGKGFGRKFLYLSAGIVFLALIWFVLPEEQKGRFATIWDPSTGPESAEVSAEGRVEGYKAGMKMFDRFPISGVGIGNFIPYRESYIDGVPLNAHNLAGQILGETGIVGAGAFFFMVLITAVNCYRIIWQGKRNASDSAFVHFSGIGFACRDALILLAFEGTFGHNLLRYNWLWLAAFSGLALQFGRNKIQNKINKNDNR